MLEQLAEIAAERGINRFDAEVLSENRAMLGVFKGAGFGVRRRGSYGELTVSLDIPSCFAPRAADRRLMVLPCRAFRLCQRPRSGEMLAR